MLVSRSAIDFVGRLKACDLESERDGQPSCTWSNAVPWGQHEYAGDEGEDGANELQANGNPDGGQQLWNGSYVGAQQAADLRRPVRQPDSAVRSQALPNGRKGQGEDGQGQTG